MSEYRLTNEGKEYLEHGLPEKNLVELLKSGPENFDKLKSKIKNFPIALQWAKKKNLIETKDGKFSLVAKKIEFPEQDALEKISRNEEVSEEILNVLLQRKLVEKIQVEAEKFAKEIEGKEITNLTPEILKNGLWKKVKLLEYDVDVPPQKIQQGKIHPYRQVLDEVRERFVGLGFKEMINPLVEMSFWNFDALFVPQDHPARSWHDAFMIKGMKSGKILDKELWKRVEQTHKDGWITGSRGWGGQWNVKDAQTVLARSHDTGASAHALYGLKKEDLPAKIFFISRVFRPDVIDAKHLIEFDQCGGIVVGEGLTLKNLLGYLKEIALAATGAEKVRFKPSYFPFTEPSVEGYAYHPKLGWYEFGGAGIFRPELTAPLGIEVPVLAWGLGIGRLAMIKMKSDDIRDLFSDNVEWLRQKSLVR